MGPHWLNPDGAFHPTHILSAGDKSVLDSMLGLENGVAVGFSLVLHKAKALRTVGGPVFESVAGEEFSELAKMFMEVGIGNLVGDSPDENLT